MFGIINAKDSQLINFIVIEIRKHNMDVFSSLDNRV